MVHARTIKAPSTHEGQVLGYGGPRTILGIAATAIGVSVTHPTPRNLSETLPGHRTNNRAELVVSVGKILLQNV